MPLCCSNDGSEHGGEVAGALGSFVGGVIGAGGAVLAVYVALASARDEETRKVSAAVKTEVASLTTYIIGAMEACQQIASGERQVPRRDAGYIIRKLFVEPVVYKAVADRIGLLPAATFPRRGIELIFDNVVAIKSCDQMAIISAGPAVASAK